MFVFYFVGAILAFESESELISFHLRFKHFQRCLSCSSIKWNNQIVHYQTLCLFPELRVCVVCKIYVQLIFFTDISREHRSAFGDSRWRQSKMKAVKFYQLFSVGKKLLLCTSICDFWQRVIILVSEIKSIYRNNSFKRTTFDNHISVR